jgi:hypothetical protein
MRVFLANVAALFAFASSPACVSMPDPPPHPEDLSAPGAQYDHPRAVVPVELVQRLVDEGLGYGNWWLPVVELPLTSAQIVPELNFFVRF